MVRYIQQSEKEVFILKKEQEKREIYLEKLKNDLVLAISYEEKCEKGCSDSKAAV